MPCQLMFSVLEHNISLNFVSKIGTTVLIYISDVFSDSGPDTFFKNDLFLSLTPQLQLLIRDTVHK